MNKLILTKQPRSNNAMAKAKRLFELKVQYKEMKAEIDELHADLLQVMQNNDTLTLKTGSYTLSRGKRVTPKVEDFEALKAELDKRDIPYQTIEAFSRNMIPVFQEFIEHNEDLPGLVGTETEYVSIRISDKK